MAWTAPRTWVTGETVTAALMNTHIRDNLLAVGPTITKVVKSADETIDTSTTFQNDDELLWAMGTNESWIFMLGLFNTGNTTADFKYLMVGPTSFTTTYGMRAALEETGSVQHQVALDETDSGGQGIVAAGTVRHFLITGVMATAGTAGNGQLQWAQLVSNASDTTLKAGSYLIAHRV